MTYSIPHTHQTCRATLDAAKIEQRSNQQRTAVAILALLLTAQEQTSHLNPAVPINASCRQTSCTRDGFSVTVSAESHVLGVCICLGTIALYSVVQQTPLPVLDRKDTDRMNQLSCAFNIGMGRTLPSYCCGAANDCEHDLQVHTARNPLCLARYATEDSLKTQRIHPKQAWLA